MAQAPLSAIKTNIKELKTLYIVKQLMEGTASSQIIAHFLKLGTTTAALEKEKLKNENLLLEAKTKSIKDAADMKELYADAIAAMKRYSGHGDDDY